MMGFLFALWLSITENSDNQDIDHVKIRRKKFAWMGKFHYNRHPGRGFGFEAKISAFGGVKRLKPPLRFKIII